MVGWLAGGLAGWRVGWLIRLLVSTNRANKYQKGTERETKGEKRKLNENTTVIIGRATQILSPTRDFLQKM